MLLERRKSRVSDIRVQGVVAIAAGIIVFSSLFFPWLSSDYTAVSGLSKVTDQAAVAVPMTVILLALLTLFGGVMHIAGYRVGIQMATITSAISFFISTMAIIVTFAQSFEGEALHILVGPWIGAVGSICGAISSKLERI